MSYFDVFLRGVFAYLESSDLLLNFDLITLNDNLYTCIWVEYEYICVSIYAYCVCITFVNAFVLEISLGIKKWGFSDGIYWLIAV